MKDNIRIYFVVKT